MQAPPRQAVTTTMARSASGEPVPPSRWAAILVRQSMIDPSSLPSAVAARRQPTRLASAPEETVVSQAVCAAVSRA